MKNILDGELDPEYIRRAQRIDEEKAIDIGSVADLRKILGIYNELLQS